MATATSSCAVWRACASPDHSTMMMMTTKTGKLHSSTIRMAPSLGIGSSFPSRSSGAIGFRTRVKSSAKREIEGAPAANALMMLSATGARSKSFDDDDDSDHLDCLSFGSSFKPSLLSDRWCRGKTHSSLLERRERLHTCANVLSDSGLSLSDADSESWSDDEEVDLLEAIAGDSDSTSPGPEAAELAGTVGANVPPATVAFSANNPYANLDQANRFSIAGKAQGYGSKATGGNGGRIYTVTDFSATKREGTLAFGLSMSGPLWIVFDQSAADNAPKTPDGSPCIDYTTIPFGLGQDEKRLITVTSNKTIDGRGLRKPVTIFGAGLQLTKGVKNVIITNIVLDGAAKQGKGGVVDDNVPGHSSSNIDAIQIKGAGGSVSDVWIDRCTLRNYVDGLIDVTYGSNNITVSRCHFLDHNKACLFGSSDKLGRVDAKITVTLHHNFFDGLHQRHPRLRFGHVHMYNNFVSRWKQTGVALGAGAQILMQENYFLKGDADRALNMKLTGIDDTQGLLSVGDIYNPTTLYSKNPSFEAAKAKFKPAVFADIPTTPNALTIENVSDGEQLAQKLRRITGAWEDPDNKTFKF